MAKLKLLLISTVLAVSGCASMNSEFNCPAGKGVGCKSIHEINQMVDEGVLSSGESQPQPHILKTTLTPLLVDINETALPQRSAEKILRVWIASYEDIEGNWHSPQTVHTVVKKAEWQYPIKPQPPTIESKASSSDFHPINFEH